MSVVYITHFVKSSQALPYCAVFIYIFSLLLIFGTKDFATVVHVSHQIKICSVKPMAETDGW